MSTEETIIVDGIVFRRYPKSKIRNDRVYFKAHIHIGTPIYLHRYLYEKYHGKIPNDKEIHHKDLNPLNNSLDNLELVSKSEHLKKHFDSDPIRLSKQQEHLLKINPLTKEWHRSEEGREWHRKNAKTTIQARPLLKRKCDFCHIEYQTKGNGRDRFCSNRCKSAQRRKEISDIQKLIKYSGL